LALARPAEDELTAAGLMAVVESARGRGEPSALAELAELAARRTPADLSGERDQRLLAAAEFACDAGHREESERAAEAVLAGSGSARARVRARLVLLSNAGQALWDKTSLIEAGLRDAAGDPALEAALYHWAALRGLLCGELDAAGSYARRSAAQAVLATSTDIHLAALSTLARVHSLSGQPAAAEAALTQAVTLSPHASPLRRMRAILALDSDDIPQAFTHLRPLFPDPAPEFWSPAAPEPAGQRQASGVEDFVASLVSLIRVQVRAGECRGAVRSAAWCVRVAGPESGPAVYAEALAETYGGRVERARELAAREVRASEADGDRLFLIRALAVQGQAALFGGDRAGAADAVESLRRVLEIGTAMRAADPPLLSWYADLAEALVTLGETDAAQDVLAEAYRWVPAQAPGSVWASLERARGRWEAATGDPKEGAALLRSSAERLRPLVLPVELVRTLTALGAVERRARHRTAARNALTEALDLAERTGAAPLANRARDELARVDAAARGASGDQLTPAEARILELVRGGATNREVATALFISVKTVEGTLSRLFRKFGVRTRTALANCVSQETHG
jgi:DNA-binding CsgD family transcriptional regulator